MEYPRKFKDKLGRVIYTEVDEFEKNFYTFYGDSNKIKVKYISRKESVYFDAFSRKGSLLISNVFGDHNNSIKKNKWKGFSFVICKEKLKIINNLN